MNNNIARSKFWKEFILFNCDYPARNKLEAQFFAGEVSDFCDCGCNSFNVSISESSNIQPIASPGKYGLVFEAQFRLANESKTLEIMLFANEAGNLAHVEIDCCSNSLPVPEEIIVTEPPFHVFASESLLNN